MSRRRRKGRGWSDADKIKYIRMMAVPLVIVAVLVIIILVMDKKPKETDATTDSKDSSVEIVVQESGTTGTIAESDTVAPDNSEYKTDFSDYELKKDEVPEVTRLISDYFQAKVDQDAEALYRIFGKSDTSDLSERQSQLEEEAKFIEDYQDIVCYTKEGMTEDSYVAYVTYKIKFRRVDTLAPGLMWCYVVKDESGQYIIRENVVGEEADYVAKANQTEDVRLLASQINQQLKEALESDTLLAGVYKKLQNGAVVRATEESRDSEVSIITDETGATGQGESGSAGEGQGSGAAGAGESGAAGQGSEPGSAGEGQDGGTGAQTESETSDSAGDSSAAQDNVQGTGESSSASEVKIGE